MTRQRQPVLIAAVIICVALAGCSDASGVASAAEVPKAETDEPTKRRERLAGFTAVAVESLERSAGFLAAQKSYSFEADVSYDVLQPNGQMLEFGGTRDVLMRRPDRLRVETIGRDGEVMQLFFDGKSILIDLPEEDAYVEVGKPGSLYAAMDYLVEDLDIPSPLEDFVSENFAADVGGKIESGFYVEHVQLGDQICEQLAFRTPEIDFQLWVQAGEEPVPCRLVITYKQAPGQPQFTAQFREWNLSPESGDEMFEFTPPETAERLQVQGLAAEVGKQRGTH